MGNSQKDKGMYNKFIVSRTDGHDAPGQKHEDCKYFVLDLTHDPFALPALMAYAEACKIEYPLLARDLTEIISAMYEEHGMPQNDPWPAHF